jgi:hypothetical protein
MILSLGSAPPAPRNTARPPSTNSSHEDDKYSRTYTKEEISTER